MQGDQVSTGQESGRRGTGEAGVVREVRPCMMQVGVWQISKFTLLKVLCAINHKLLFYVGTRCQMRK